MQFGGKKEIICSKRQKTLKEGGGKGKRLAKLQRKGGENNKRENMFAVKKRSNFYRPDRCVIPNQ